MEGPKQGSEQERFEGAWTRKGILRKGRRARLSLDIGAKRTAGGNRGWEWGGRAARKTEQLRKRHKWEKEPRVAAGGVGGGAA